MPVLCPRCGGSGIVHDTPYVISDCSVCGATGKARHDIAAEWITAHPHSQAARAFDDRPTTLPCPACEACVHCHGAHMVTPARVAEIRAFIAARKPTP